MLAEFKGCLRVLKEFESWHSENSKALLHTNCKAQSEVSSWYYEKYGVVAGGAEGCGKEVPPGRGDMSIPNT